MSNSTKDQKKAAFYEKLQQLRSAASSTGMNTASILIDASKYIEELKERVDQLNQEVGTSQVSDDEDDLPAQVKVETLEKGFLVSVFSERNHPGLLVSVLEVFEDLGLEVLDATISCSDMFRLEAVSHEKEEVDSIDAKMIKQAVVQAIKIWSTSTQQP